MKPGIHRSRGSPLGHAASSRTEAPRHRDRGTEAPRHRCSPDPRSSAILAESRRELSFRRRAREHGAPPPDVAPKLSGWSLVTTSAQRVRSAAHQADPARDNGIGGRLAKSLAFAGARAALAAAGAGLATMTILVVI